MELFKQKILYFSLGIFILIAGIFAVNALIAGTRHSQTEILVEVKGYKMTLQEAINSDYISQNADSPMSAGTTSLSVGHLPSEIWVSVDGSEMTLAAAIATDNLCGTTSVPYTGSINPGHFANEIEITVSGWTKTLQEAIDNGDFCVVTTYSYGSWSDWGSCSTSCGGGTQSRTRTCEEYVNGISQGNVDCSSCGGACSESQNCNTQSCYCLKWQEVDEGGCGFGGCQVFDGSCNCHSPHCSSCPELVGQPCGDEVFYEGFCCGFTPQSPITIKCMSVLC